MRHHITDYIVYIKNTSVAGRASGLWKKASRLYQASVSMSYEGTQNIRTNLLMIYMFLNLQNFPILHHFPIFHHSIKANSTVSNVRITCKNPELQLPKSLPSHPKG